MMISTMKFGAALAVLAFVATAQAQPTVTPADTDPGATIVPRAGFGGQTDLWLEEQLTPAYTANDVRPISGEVASEIYARYLKSFRYPIPQTFNRESFTGSSGGGDSSGGSSSSSSGSSGGGSSSGP